MIRKLSAALLLTVFALGSFSVPAQGKEPVEGAPPMTAEAKEKQEILVKFKPNINAAQAKGHIQQAGATEVDEVKGIGVKVLRVPANAAPKVLAALNKNPNVEYAEMNSSYQLTRWANDPYYASQWSLKNTRAAYAWDTTTGSTGVIIAVIDSGVDIYHPDLKGKIVKPYNAAWKTTNVVDERGHGTGVASALAANTYNGLGVSGMCWACKVMPVKVFGSATGGANWDYVARGVIYAADNGAKVINMSLGGGGYSSTTASAVSYARSKGVVVVAAAGNTSSSAVNYPGGFDGVIAVAATDPNNRRYSFSAYGSWVDMSAPGCGIVAAPGNRYSTNFCGTSYASPLVAGVAGLIRSKYPTASAKAVETALLSTTTALSSSPSAKGLLNAEKAVKYSLLAQAAVKSTSPTQYANRVSVKPTLAVNFTRNVTGLTSSTVILKERNTGARVAATLSYSSTTFQLKVTPTTNLKTGTTYALVTTTGIKDALGSPVKAYTLYFTTNWPTKTGDMVFSPTRAVTFNVGKHTGIRVDDSGKRLGSKTITLTKASSAATNLRTTLVNESGRWFYITNGSLAGYYIQQNSTQYLAGFLDKVTYPNRQLTLAAGTYTAYKYDTAGKITASKKYSLGKTSGTSVNSSATINGVAHYYVTAGVWAGYWMPAGTGRTLGGYTDKSAPTITGRSPAVNATSILPTASVVVTFSEPVNGVSANTVYLTKAGVKIPATVTYDATAKRATLKPSAALTSLTGYTVTVTAGVVDPSGNKLVANSWNFTTKDVVAPTTSGHSPANGIVNIDVDSVVTVKFNEAVTGVSSTTFTLKDNTTGALVAGTVDYDSATRTASFIPSSSLLYSTEYTATLTNGIKDSSGNLLATQSWGFTTGIAPDTTPPSDVSEVSVEVISETQAKLTWPASTDDTAVAFYELYLDTTNMGRNSLPQWTLSGLDPAITYQVFVLAYDTAGNYSTPVFVEVSTTTE